MRNLFTRAAAAAAVLILALPVAASAAVDEYVAEASTTTVELSVFEDQVGDPLLELVGTEAFSDSTPTASGVVSAMTVVGTQVGAIRSAESDRERDRDPESGDGCALPVDTTGFTLDALCAVASARAGNPGDTGNQDAAATTDLTDVAVNGSLIAELLTGRLDDLLVGMVDELADGAVAEAINVFRDGCNALLGDPTLDPLDQLPNTAAELIAELEGATGAELDAIEILLDAFGADNPCTAIFNLTVKDVTAPVFDVGPVADALEGQNLVTFTLDGAKSQIAGTDTTMGADAEQVFVTITGPSLAFLDDVINGVVQGFYDGLVEELERVAGQEMPEEFDLSDEIADALAQIPLFGIDDPLLRAVVSGGSASADLVLEDNASSSGGDQPFVQVTIAPGIVELLGGSGDDASLTLAAGEEGTIAEGTPAESSVSVGTLTTNDDATYQDTDLTGSTATASATEVALLTGVEGGVVLTLSRSTAGVFGKLAPASAAAPNPAPDSESPLPNTGGGAAVAAVLALGVAAALRRRRD